MGKVHVLTRGGDISVVCGDAPFAAKPHEVSNKMHMGGGLGGPRPRFCVAAAKPQPRAKPSVASDAMGGTPPPKAASYELIRSRRKTISITITPDARVVVRAPLRVSVAIIESFLGKKRKWIDEKLGIVEQRAAAHRQGEFLSGEEFPYLGRKLLLTISDTAKCIEAVGGVLVFPRAWLPKAEERLKKWYRAEAAAIVASHLEAVAERTGLKPLSVGITDARSRWGSCSSGRKVNFTWRLVMAPSDVVEYVIVHELVHIRHMNHSREFWGMVGRIMPEFAEKKKWLKENNALLQLF